MHVKTSIVALLALAPSIAAAHPGHGHTPPETWTHYLTEPLHVGVLAAVVSLVTVVRRARRRTRRDRAAIR
jgi:hypothetical protein